MINVFLSYPQPHKEDQQAFINKLNRYLENRGIRTLTLGVNEYNNNAPLNGIRKIMDDSFGLLSIAFKRTFVEKCTVNKGSNISKRGEIELQSVWFSSPFIQIEAAMAFQIELPILVFKESGVIAEGILEKGVTGFYMPEFSMGSSDDVFESAEFVTLISNWIHQVRTVNDNRKK